MLPLDLRDLLGRNLERYRLAVRAAADRARRDPDGVSLLAVTKYAGPEHIRILHELGLRDFGESRVQRGVVLRRDLADLGGVRWHLIGHLQRNKVRRALETFHSLHSLDSMRLAEALVAEARGHPLPALWVEVNVAREGAKTGLAEEELDDVLSFLRRSGVSAAGLMAMAPRGREPEDSRPSFRRLRELRDERVAAGLLLPGAGLSMGMSEDYPVAVEEGATVVRVGSSLLEGLE
jgi:pyridoxal phosphate enzyme (YggS family)